VVARILCVEDNPQNMRLVRKMLNNAGYDVIEASDGMSGLESALSEHPDLILMDVNLPDIDGLEVTARLRQTDEMRAVPIVALTANAMHGDRERCLGAGCTGYIPKPITKSELLNTVAHFLGQIARVM
jgi:two-component system, cell cycle response regulator DivK